MEKVLQRKISPGALFEPQPHMRPCIRIAPFSSLSWDALNKTPSSNRPALGESPEFWLKGAKHLRFYRSGRDAILAALKNEGLQKNDEVLILTTTQGPYISSCVTKTIEMVCRWSRRMTDRTKMALVIHEFGFPCGAPEIALCRRKGIPILEDCAYALGTRRGRSPVGTLGDYAVYSLTKHYPFPFGGVLAGGKKKIAFVPPLEISAAERKMLLSVLRKSAAQERIWNENRRKNWQFFHRALSRFGIQPFFDLRRGIVPGAFVARLPKGRNGAKIKVNLVNAGVESTEYYGMGGFYFPVHPFLTGYDRQYILHHFLKN